MALLMRDHRISEQAAAVFMASFRQKFCGTPDRCISLEHPKTGKHIVQLICATVTAPSIGM